MDTEEPFFEETEADRTPYRSCIGVALIGILVLIGGSWAVFSAGSYLRTHLRAIKLPAISGSSAKQAAQETGDQLKAEAELRAQAAAKQVGDQAAEAAKAQADKAIEQGKQEAATQLQSAADQVKAKLGQ